MSFLPTIHEPVYPADPYMPERRYPWTGRERQVLRERYIREGLAVCERMLPTRSRGAILNECARLGLRRQKTHAKPRESNEMLDAGIRKLYADRVGKGEVAAFAARHRVSRQWVYARAVVLGVALKRRRYPAWSAEEDALLEMHATKTPPAIAKIFTRNGFDRTPAAIVERRWRRQLDSWDPDVMTAKELGRCMGVGEHAALRWIARCGLKAKKTGEGEKCHWQIKRKDIRAWLIASREWDHRKADRDWLVEILSGVSGSRASEAA